VETLVYINNTFGPWLGEICAVFYAIAAITLSVTWYKSRSKDALLVFGYLTALIVAVYLPDTWLNLFALAAFHLMGYSLLFWLHSAHGMLRTVFGDYFMLMAGLMGLTDSIVAAWPIPIQVQVFIVDSLFLIMCVSSLFVCLNSYHNGGDIGTRRNDGNTEKNKAVDNALKG